MVNIENTKTVGTIKEKPEITKSNSKKFLDVHSLKGFKDEEILRKLQQSPTDEFGITHINMMYNKEDDKFFAFLRHQIEKQSKIIIINMASNMNG